MASGKETPRQKLIGLMYLVLMALLAMNVSKEVINSFVTLSNNMDQQYSDLAVSNSTIVSLLESKSNGTDLGDDERVELKKTVAKAQLIHDMTRATSNFYIENANFMLQKGQEGNWTFDGGDGFLSIVDLVIEEYEKKDDYDIPTNLFVGDDHSNINSKGKAIIDHLENYRDSLCMLLADRTDLDTKIHYSFSPPELKKATQKDTAYLEVLEQALSSVKSTDKQTIRDVYRLLTLPRFVENHGEQYPWQAGQFDHAPMVAASAMFTSLKGRVLQAEKFVLNNFNEQNKQPPFKFNKVQPLAFAATNYINKGDSLSMSVMVAAFDSAAKPEVRFWRDDTLRLPENMEKSTLNMLKFGGSVGEHIIVGDIAVETKTGIEWQAFTYEYSVGAPNATIAASDLNVLYAGGWKNKIAVSASGYDPSTISVKGTKNCTVSKQNGEYIVTATKVTKQAVITVYAKDKDNKTVKLSSQEFAIYPLPKPEAIYAGQTSETTSITKSLLKAKTPINAKLFNQPLNVKYTVTKFQMSTGKGVPMKSNNRKLTDQMKKAIDNIQKGQTVTFLGIWVAGPNGKERPIASLSFYIK